MQRSMKNHTKHLNGACEGDLGSTMVAHGSDFEPDSEFGMCLTGKPDTSASEEPTVSKVTDQ